MPPSLSVSVGVPPATVTASLRFSVSVTMLPVVRSPDPAVMPVPDAATEVTEGAVVSICRVPAGLGRPADWRRLAAAVFNRRDQIDPRHSEVGGILAGPDRVGECQRIVPEPASIGRNTTIVKGQRRCCQRPSPPRSYVSVSVRATLCRWMCNRASGHRCH